MIGNNVDSGNPNKTGSRFSGYCILFLILFAGFVIFNPFTWLMIGMSSLPDPPEPSIKYAEFPFELTYEINGEVEVYADTFIYEYDGIEDKGTGGKSRIWKCSVKSTGNESIVFKDVSMYKKYDANGLKILSLYFDEGNGFYNMGDKSSYQRPPQSFSYVYYFAEKENGSITTDSMSNGDAYRLFGLKFISWECAPPIENNKYK